MFIYIYIYIYKTVRGQETEDKNKQDEVKTKGAHLGRFCQGSLRANMITQSQNPRRLACLRIQVHSLKGRGLAMKTTRHVIEEMLEGLSLSG